MIGLNRSHDPIHLPLQFSTQLSSSGGIILSKNQGYSLIKVFNYYFVGSQYPIFHKIGNARWVNHLNIRGARGITIHGKLPRNWIILAQNIRCPFVYAL